MTMLLKNGDERLVSSFGVNGSSGGKKLYFANFLLTNQLFSKTPTTIKMWSINQLSLDSLFYYRSLLIKLQWGGCAVCYTIMEQEQRQEETSIESVGRGHLLQVQH